MTLKQYKVFRGLQLLYRDYEVTAFNNSGKIFITINDEKGLLGTVYVNNDGEVTDSWRRQDD